jgi:protocatechuate 3,4-dioxygenase beta subunit
VNEKGMIRQYITFALVLLIAVFIVTQLQWSELPVQLSLQTDDSLLIDADEKANSSQKEISFSDFRAGRVGGSRRQQNTSETFLSPPAAPQNTAASSSPYSAATSTPFQAGIPKQSEYSGVSVELSRISKTPGTTPLPTKEASSKEGNSLPDVVSDLNISGHVVDNNGEPIAGLALTLKLRQATADNQAAFAGRTLNTQSNAQGAYSFINLVEGDYQVCTVAVKAYTSACRSPRAPHSSADFSLRNMLSGRIYGAVTDEQGKPLSEVSISATPNQKNQAVTDKKGKFSLKMAVNADLSYQIYFNKTDYTAERVSVIGAEILEGKQINTILDKIIFSGFDVNGTIYDQSGSPVSGRTVKLTSPTVKTKQALRAASGPNGEFIIKHVIAADDYRLSVNTGGGYTFDASPYSEMQVFEGMSPLRLELETAGLGSFSARVVSSNGTPITGEMFSLYSGSAYVGRSNSDTGGEIRFENVPVKTGGSPLRISGGSSPRYTFSGVTLAEGEHQSGLELVVDRGQNSLVLTVKDENQNPIQGAQGVLIWASSNNGVRSQTMRSRGKISMAGTGIINFSELGQGEHRLQIRRQGYLSYSTSIDIKQQTQYEDVVLVKIEE